MGKDLFMGKKMNLDYPVQMASIGKNDWRLAEHEDKNIFQLLLIEYNLWSKISKRAKAAPRSPEKLRGAKNSELIGEGWEWSVYKTKRKELPVVKVPRGIFSEVAEKEYLDNVEQTYEMIKKYFPVGLIAETEFAQMEIGKERMNVIYQEYLEGGELRRIHRDWITKKQKEQLIQICEGMLKILKEENWVLDLQIHRWFAKGKRCWNSWNLLTDASSNVKLFDFSGYYDGMRMYPARAKVEAWHRKMEIRLLLKHLKK